MRPPRPTRDRVATDFQRDIFAGLTWVNTKVWPCDGSRTLMTKTTQTLLVLVFNRTAYTLYV